MSSRPGTSSAVVSREYTFRCSLRNGLHARPATHLVEVASRYDSDISLTNQRTQAIADGKSLLSLVSIDLAESDECHVQIRGIDAEAALHAMCEFTRDVLPACDEPPLPAPVPNVAMVVPRALRDTTFYPGTPVCDGVGRGRVVLLDGFAFPTDLDTQASGSIEVELRRVEDVFAAVRAKLAASYEAVTDETERGVLKAHLSIVSDNSLRSKVTALVNSGSSAGDAINQISRYFIDLFQSSDNAVTRDRAVDVKDIAMQLLKELYGDQVQQGHVRLTTPSIVVAENLTPSQFQALDKQYLEGLILEHAGATSHAMILAAAHGIPTLTDVSDACVRLANVETVIVDANCSLVIPDVNHITEAHYQRVKQRDEQRQHRLERYVGCGVQTTDGQAFSISANVSTGIEVAKAHEQGADGVGLFRTELMYMDREDAPTEEELFTAYAETARVAGPHGVTLRTIDIGGDKPVAYLDLNPEENPFLGNRGVRLYRDKRDLFAAQLRAILRASAFGKLKLMVPMVSNVEEIRWVKSRIAETKQSLKAAGQAFDENLSIGIMVEVPSVVYQLRDLSHEVDFFSIGTNDLAQYFFAVDRGNERVTELCDTSHPAFLRFLKTIIDEAHRHGRPVSICGEMARSARMLPLLVGLGLDGISVAPSAILRLKALLSGLSAAECRRVADTALDATDPREVEVALQTYHAQGLAIQMSEPDLMLTDSHSHSKAAAIAEFVDALYVAGRTDAPEIIESAFWTREETCSTAVGHGFAIPHCKTDAITVNSFGVVRLADPIEWGDDSDTPVHCMVILAIRESDPDRTHMRVLAKLARKLMEDSFRSRIMAAGDRIDLLNCLAEELHLKS